MKTDKENRLMDYFETLLEETLEQKLFAWLPNQNEPNDVLQKILATLEAQHDHAAIYDILLHVSTEDYPIWFNNQAELIDLSNRIYHHAQQGNIPLPRPPAFHIFSEVGLPSGQISVETIPYRGNRAGDLIADKNTDDPEDGTMLFKPEKLTPDRTSAFLTNSENKVIPIEKTTTNLGRKEDNDIVVSDQRVSRLHAQIRYSQGSYVIFDLNSTSGTYINDQKINQHHLTSGDVISLGGVNFIFVIEENDQEDDITRDLQGKTVAPPPKPMDDRKEFS